jgi:hypothetical protein
MNEVVPINHNVLSNLESYDDYLSFYIQLDQTTSAFAWLKADLLHQMLQRLGEGSLEQLSNDLREKRSTVANYVRVARAYPVEARDPMASFSLHLRASYADSYDEKTKEFSGNERFKWVQKAVDEKMSTRALGDALWLDKQQKLLGEQANCTRCHNNEGDINLYNLLLHSPLGGLIRDRVLLHIECYNEILNFIYGDTRPK